MKTSDGLNSYERTQTQQRRAAPPPPFLGLKAIHADDVTRRVVMASLGPKVLLLQFS